ncbi:response regulator transcription factor [Paenibacillus alvei]|uniref:Response regulator transcription factor n=1 Tax=Paenibacillus alvei TaxID=44250 RepID=A0ABT4GZD2_PAEAL|nr:MULTISPECIES: response regulator transcription factor [Paenibacillus]MCY7486854.1 response regulator transcription factor [Paenibacillus alvei]MCY9737130.1 response regulator transcription factor [Paenibacillus alvei]MCY9762070.1 response regulator transcription factor [Paenibacillus alvei]MCY9765831.1 response regulator transcription factor [Paenibacillus alvei]
MKIILIIDDEAEIRELLTIYLTNHGYATITAGNGVEAMTILQEQPVDLVIADIMMPQMDGLELLKKTRQNSQIPFLFISAKSDDMDKIYGLQLGADDYVGKPFNPLEVVSRVQALFRRIDSHSKPDKQEQECIEIGDVRLNIRSCQLFKSGIQKELTSYEFKILELLMREAGRVLTKAHIYEQVWGEEYIGDENLIMVYISKIREKIEDNPRKPIYLITIRGLGYRFEKSK